MAELLGYDTLLHTLVCPDVPTTLRTRWLWELVLREEVSAKQMLNEAHLTGLVLCRVAGLQQPDIRGVPGDLIGRVVVIPTPYQSMTMREVHDSVEHSQMHMQPLLMGELSGPNFKEHLERLFARLGHLLLPLETTLGFIFDDPDSLNVATDGTVTRVMTSNTLRWFLNVFVILFRRIELQRCAEPPVLVGPRLELKEFHIEAATDDFYKYSQYFDLPPAASLQYSCDFGTATEFYESIASAADHGELVRMMANTRPGAVLHAGFPLLREIITMVVPKHRISATDPSDKYTLINISKRPETGDMVFALVYKLAGNLHHETHPLRAILRVCVSLQGSRYMEVMALPSSVCMVSEHPIGMTELVDPHAAWLRLLRNLDVSETNTRLNPNRTEQSWEHFCSRNARLGMPYAVKALHPQFESNTHLSMCPDGVSTEFNIKFIQDGVETNIPVNSKLADRLLCNLTTTHQTALSDIGHTVLPGVYDMVLGSGYILSFAMPNPSRVRCSLLRRDAMLDTNPDPRVVLFCDVNFMNSMVYADVRTQGIHSVVGMQRLALRAANRLQANLTPDILAMRLRTTGPTTRELLGLMLSTDLHTDISHVMACDVARSVRFCDANTPAEQTGSLLFKTHTQLVELTNSFPKVGNDDIWIMQDAVFANSEAYRKKRVTSSAGPDRPRWQDHHSVESVTDGLLTQKMMSARGAATLLEYGSVSSPVPEKTFCNHQWVFSKSNIPRLVEANLHDFDVRYSGSRTLSWLRVNDTEHRAKHQPCSSVMDRVSGERRFSQSHPAMGKHTFAVFPGEADPTITNLQYKIHSSASDPKGALVNRLLHFARVHPSVHTRALAAFVLLDAVRGQGTTDQVTTPSNGFAGTIYWSKPLSTCLNYYRAQFMEKHLADIPKTTASADELYVQYSLFSQCLKQYMHGSRTPSDMFALLVQQGIPFPQV
ncbi:hypothetical protein T484DRAFT_3634548 [Baffinella frigidus]|nr:hypothetical protein T484DRAFT_3634548 [Cryptophyta sp. CCMP2293]